MLEVLPLREVAPDDEAQLRELLYRRQRQNVSVLCVRVFLQVCLVDVAASRWQCIRLRSHRGAAVPLSDAAVRESRSRMWRFSLSLSPSCCRPRWGGLS